MCGGAGCALIRQKTEPAQEAKQKCSIFYSDIHFIGANFETYYNPQISMNLPVLIFPQLRGAPLCVEAVNLFSFAAILVGP